MISIVIPTLWRSEFIHQTIQSLIDCNMQDVELIIIDNANSDYISPDPRIRILKQERNIFVNPAWNLGVKEAKNELVCILNDDLTLNIDLLVRTMNLVLRQDPNFGIIGLYKRNFLHNKDINQMASINLVELNSRPWGFGSMMILKKSNYINIPDTLQIFFGDDYLYENAVLNNKKVYWIDGLLILGEMSKTSKDFSVPMEKESYEKELERLKQSKNS